MSLTRPEILREIYSLVSKVIEKYTSGGVYAIPEAGDALIEARGVFRVLAPLERGDFVRQFPIIYQLMEYATIRSQDLMEAENELLDLEASSKRLLGVSEMAGGCRAVQFSNTLEKSLYNSQGH